jgi:hypothetical protein
VQIKYVVLCYVEHKGSPDRDLRKEFIFENEPSREQIEEALNDVQIFDSDYENYVCKGDILRGLEVREKCKIKSIYAVVEQRFYKEGEI